MKHRWPRGVHSQIEALFHGTRSIRMTKEASPGGIRSFGAWKTYKYEAHRFASFMDEGGNTDLLDSVTVQCCMQEYLEARLTHHIRMKHSRQTMETALSALSKLEYSINQYLKQHFPERSLLATERIRMEYYSRSKQQLRKSSKIFDNRAYPDPIRLIAAITDGTFQLQASLQFEGGLRTEGVGAPSNRRLKNPLTSKGLRGTGADPVTGAIVGIISSVEKGGKETEHYVSVETYLRLEEYIRMCGKLESDYANYVEAINMAAKATDQYVQGRGTHALKHNFAQERYFQCVNHGMTHEQALQQTSLETSHFRLRETLTYTRG